MSTIPTYNINYFHRIPIGKKLRLTLNDPVLTKTSKGYAHDGNGHIRIHPQKLVFVVSGETADLDDLDIHTFDFTKAQLAEVIKQIVDRVAEDYSTKSIDPDRLRKGLYCAHRTKPIRLIALLNSCSADFPADVILGVYRHYNPKTDTIKNGWTAQHSKPHVRSFWDMF